MLSWKVIETCQASKFEEPFEREIARFQFYVLAEDFVEKVLPQENREHFQIRRA